MRAREKKRLKKIDSIDRAAAAMPTKTELLFALEELAVIYRIMQDTYRARAYKNAISDIDRALPVDGESGGQRNNTLSAADIETLRPIPTPKMLDKVREFIESGKIAKLEALKRDPKVKSFERIMKIYGVGPKTAARWIAAGIKTELDVADAANRGEIALTRAQPSDFPVHVIILDEIFIALDPLAASISTVVPMYNLHILVLTFFIV